MISASSFCRIYSSYWRDLTPTAEIFVRRLNLAHYERDFPEMKVATSPDRRGLINEIAFSAFCFSIRNGKTWQSGPISAEEIQAVFSHLHFAQGSYRDLDPASIPFVAAPEIEDISEQHRRLMLLFAPSLVSSNLVAEPQFQGCGIIDTCRGDLLVDDTLYEVKAGDRLFRSIDIRQLVTYSALNQLSKQFTINYVGLVNPRVGISAKLALDELCVEISGRGAIELLSDIASSISSGEISR